jgi:cyclase
MLKTRVIPSLLLRNGGLVKTFQFDKPKYVGDPINAVRIFNEKEVDEIVILDITATPEKREPNFELIKDLASQAFMPLAYGGGITNIQQIEKLFSIGIEKVVLDTIVGTQPELIKQAADIAGSSSVVVCMDVKSKLFGKPTVFNHGGKVDTKQDPVQFAQKVQALGAGELIFNSIDRDGMQKGYDLAMIQKIAQAIDIPLVALGGAGTLEDFRSAVDHGASAVAAGSMFVFHGKHKAVLITYPEYKKLESLFA